jgi:uncharacterized protein (DUF2235 family)
MGFSRVAYTARALAGTLRTVGLLRPGADNLIPYAVKLYAKSGGWKQSGRGEGVLGSPRRVRDPVRQSGLPQPLRAAGALPRVWDTVKSVGWLNWKARYEQAHWPFTRKLSNVAHGRHASALDERRRPNHEYCFDEAKMRAKPGRLREMWFAGVYSDIGPWFPDDHALSDIALNRVVDESQAAGLRLDPSRYKDHLGVQIGAELPDANAVGMLHTNGFGWAIVGAGWHRREIGPGDQIHLSVHRRIGATAGLPQPSIVRRSTSGPG